MDEVFYQRQARAIQVDPELLAPLGRLQVAADRLRVAVQNAAAVLHGAPLAAQPDDTLAAAVRRLAVRSSVVLVDPHEVGQLQQWCEQTAVAAAYYTELTRWVAEGATSGLMTPLLAEELLTCAGMLVDARATLPSRPPPPPGTPAGPGPGRDG